MQKTKIIATLGPACTDIKIIKDMLLSGLSVLRINASHLQDIQTIKQMILKIRNAAKQLDKPISIMMDLGGPKVRVLLPSQLTQIKIIKNGKYRLGFRKHDIPLNTKINILKINKNAKIKIDDGKLNFKVLKLENDHILVCALNNGTITNKKGVNFPGIQLQL